MNVVNIDCRSLSIDETFAGSSGHHVQHSYPVLVARRGQGRRLPPTPCKPSTLQLKPANINFPKLNASPTHVSVLMEHSTGCRITNVVKSNFRLFILPTIHLTVFIRCHIHASSCAITEIGTYTIGSETGTETETMACATSLEIESENCTNGSGRLSANWRETTRGE